MSTDNGEVKARAAWLEETNTPPFHGLGSDAPIVVNERGAKQSDSPYRFDLIDASALAVVAEILARGAKKYGANNWRGLDLEDHLNHLLVHVYAYLAGDRQDNHLGNACCRAIFALATALAQDEEDGQSPD